MDPGGAQKGRGVGGGVVVSSEDEAFPAFISGGRCRMKLYFFLSRVKMFKSI